MNMITLRKFIIHKIGQSSGFRGHCRDIAVGIRMYDRKIKRYYEQITNFAYIAIRDVFSFFNPPKVSS